MLDLSEYQRISKLKKLNEMFAKNIPNLCRHNNISWRKRTNVVINPPKMKALLVKNIRDNLIKRDIAFPKRSNKEELIQIAKRKRGI